MTNEQRKELAKQTAGLRVWALADARTAGLELQCELEQVVADLQLAGLDEAEARWFLGRFFRAWKRRTSHDFHLRLRRATRGATQPALRRQTPRLTLVPASEG